MQSRNAFFWEPLFFSVSSPPNKNTDDIRSTKKKNDEEKKRSRKKKDEMYDECSDCEQEDECCEEEDIIIVEGPQGYSGSQGIGNPGVQGPRGYQGWFNEQGTQGPRGQQGPDSVGPDGFQGPQGFLPILFDLYGPQGFQGFDGPNTFVGPQGPQGSIGNRGTQGSFLQGLQGFIGVGFQGVQGTMGAKGPDAIGPQGPQGFNGSAIVEAPLIPNTYLGGVTNTPVVVYTKPVSAGTYYVRIETTIQCTIPLVSPIGFIAVELTLGGSPIPGAVRNVTENNNGFQSVVIQTIVTILSSSTLSITLFSNTSSSVRFTYFTPFTLIRLS